MRIPSTRLSASSTASLRAWLAPCALNGVIGCAASPIRVTRRCRDGGSTCGIEEACCWCMMLALTKREADDFTFADFCEGVRSTPGSSGSRSYTG
eukprot:scaffold274561_cov31-Tisochrysis_lutea.AAC.3